MLTFLPPAGSRIQYKTTTTERVYLVTGYKDRNIALLHDLTIDKPSMIIMVSYYKPVWADYDLVNYNPHITVLD